MAQRYLQRLQVLPVQSRLLRARKTSSNSIGKKCKYMLSGGIAMKKQLLLILMMSLILLVTACGTSSGGREAEVGGNETVTF